MELSSKAGFEKVLSQQFDLDQIKYLQQMIKYPEEATAAIENYLDKKDNVPFDTFWEMYGLRKNRTSAEKAWLRIRKVVQEEIINKHLSKYLDSLKYTDVSKAHASSWLNAKRWKDEYPEHKDFYKIASVAINYFERTNWKNKYHAYRKPEMSVVYERAKYLLYRYPQRANDPLLILAIADYIRSRTTENYKHNFTPQEVLNVRRFADRANEPDVIATYEKLKKKYLETPQGIKKFQQMELESIKEENQIDDDEMLV